MPLTTFTKRLILDIWVGSEYASTIFEKLQTISSGSSQLV